MRKAIAITLDQAERRRLEQLRSGRRVSVRMAERAAIVLHQSLIADAHRPEFGPLSEPGNLSFIEADGSLRPGHDVFNEF